MTTFRGTLQLSGKTATGIEVPASVLESLGSGQRPAVTATINAHAWRTTVGSMAGRAMLPVPAEHRLAAGVAAGDELDVKLEIDTAPREVVVPDDLALVLDADPGVRAAFEALSYSNRRRHVLQVADARTPETRARRVAKVIEALRPGEAS